MSAPRLSGWSCPPERPSCPRFGRRSRRSSEAARSRRAGLIVVVETGSLAVSALGSDGDRMTGPTPESLAGHDPAASPVRHRLSVGAGLRRIGNMLLESRPILMATLLALIVIYM